MRKRLLTIAVAAGNIFKYAVSASSAAEVVSQTNAIDASAYSYNEYAAYVDFPARQLSLAVWYDEEGKAAEINLSDMTPMHG